MKYLEPVMVNVAVIYYSSTGTVAEIAGELAETAEKAGAEVRLRPVAELALRGAIESNPAWVAHMAATAGLTVATADDMVWADAVIFGTPARFGNVSSQLKQFIDTLGGLQAKGLLADKVYSGFTSATTAHGGHEATLLALYHSVHHFGGILVTPGYTDQVHDNPYGTSHDDAFGAAPVGEPTRAAARAQARRVVRFARALESVERR
ncbi:flavodoxin family protein [Nonomuraea sp. NPDC048916]|uniref:flavodoxin family protein n=1 Tax=Nonomuraea sp. NPDC048916 TaxID=3154232 RepID=UPI0033EF7ACE